MNNKFREPINGFTHVFGAIVSLVGLVLMVAKVLSSENFSLASLSSAIIFGLSLILLYTTSGVYHLLNSSDKVLSFMRKLDHSMIFILIAGTYTPICLIALDGAFKWGLLIGIWSIAILGILFKMIWFNAPRWISTFTYVFMGWIIVAFFSPLSEILNIYGFIWLFVGGVFYTIGGIIYAKKSPNLSIKFGFHELFHIFVLLGSLSHFILVFNYII